MLRRTLLSELVASIDSGNAMIVESVVPTHDELITLPQGLATAVAAAFLLVVLIMELGHSLILNTL